MYMLAISNAGCGQIGMPTGGPKDSIPPRLLKANPEIYSTQIKDNKITLTFDEYIEVKDVQTNLLISPYPKKTPTVDYKLKTVSIKLKDTLIPNTTYSIHFGNAIVDINEGNPLKDFTYVFSTGSRIDSFKLSGKVIIAQTGKADSTLLALLYRNTNDSAVIKNKPDYLTRLNGEGEFTFSNLPAGTFNVYALKDGDGGKTYNSKKELFAFIDSSVNVDAQTIPVTLYASAIETESTIQNKKPAPPAKKLSFQTPGVPSQDLLTSFDIIFNNPLKIFNPQKLVLTDSNYNPQPTAQWSIDSSRTKVSLSVKWPQEMHYRLIIDTAAIEDSAGNHLAKNDTLRFTTKKQTDYANVILRFSNLDLNTNPVLQFVQNDIVKQSYPLTSTQWKNDLMYPGEYELRILFDRNKNGLWDAGDYSKKLQPEKVIPLPQKLNIKENWDNERDIIL